MKTGNKDLRRFTASTTILVLLFGMAWISTLFQAPVKKSADPLFQITHMAHPPIDPLAVRKAVNPPEGYSLPIVYGQIGVQLAQAGVIDLPMLQSDMQQKGQAITDLERKALTQGDPEPIVITLENALYLKDLFWAIGLANQNAILEQDAIQTKLTSLPSLATWKLSRQPALTFFAKKEFFSLTPEQQSRLEEVAKAIYLPCCDNSVFTPDCQHNMAMLGLLEMLAAQDVGKNEMFAAAKNAKAYWFPQQTQEQAIFFIATQLKEYPNVSAEEIVGAEVSSKNGFEQIHQWLAKNGMLRDDENDAINCLE